MHTCYRIVSEFCFFNTKKRKKTCDIAVFIFLLVTLLKTRAYTLYARKPIPKMEQISVFNAASCVLLGRKYQNWG